MGNIHWMAVPRFGFDAMRADYYGYTWAVQIGWLLIFIGRSGGGA